MEVVSLPFSNPIRVTVTVLEPYVDFFQWIPWSTEPYAGVLTAATYSGIAGRPSVRTAGASQNLILPNLPYVGPKYSTQTTVTFECWVYLAATMTGQMQVLIDPQMIILCQVSAGTAALSLSDPQNSGVTPSVNTTVNAWHHVVVEVTATSGVTMSVDGVDLSPSYIRTTGWNDTCFTPQVARLSGANPAHVSGIKLAWGSV